MKIGSSRPKEPQSERAKQKLEKREKAQKRDAKEKILRRLHLLFLLGGVGAKLAGTVFMVITIIIHGRKFRENELTSVKDNTKLDGAGQDLEIALLILSVFALMGLLINVCGPFAMQRRWSFVGQMVGLASDICMAAVTKTACDRWPSEEVKEWSPNKWLYISALLVLSGGLVLVYVAYHLTGTGYYPLKKKKVKYIHVGCGGDLEEGTMGGGDEEALEDEADPLVSSAPSPLEMPMAIVTSREHKPR